MTEHIVPSVETKARPAGEQGAQRVSLELIGDTAVAVSQIVMRNFMPGEESELVGRQALHGGRGELDLADMALGIDLPAVPD